MNADFTDEVFNYFVKISRSIAFTCISLFESGLVKALLTGDGLCTVVGGGVIARIGVLGALGL